MKLIFIVKLRQKFQLKCYDMLSEDHSSVLKSCQLEKLKLSPFVLVGAIFQMHRALKQIQQGMGKNYQFVVEIEVIEEITGCYWYY